MSNGDIDLSRRQNQEACNHELVTSEDFYVSEMEAIITHIVSPLRINASRCNVKCCEVDLVFGTMKHMLSFHLSFLRAIRSEVSVVPTFANYVSFVQMYIDYLNQYSDILDIMAKWTSSMEFREFMTLRLQNEQCQQFIKGGLSSMPWYLYRPFERIKQYYRFFKDLLKITECNDREYALIVKCKNTLKPLHSNIRRHEVSMKSKARLLEIQFQIFGNPEPIVTSNRHFVYNRICQRKLGGIGRKYKHIHLYIFNDGLLWCSRRGQFKRSFSFKNTNLLYGVPKQSKASDASMFIKYGSKHDINGHSAVSLNRFDRKRSGKRKDKSRTFSLSTTPDPVSCPDINSDPIHYQPSSGAYNADTALNETIGSPSGSSTVIPTPSPRPAPVVPQGISIEVHHGKPCKKTILVFVNEQVRDQCLEKIKVTQTKYLKRCQRELQRKRDREQMERNKFFPSTLSVEQSDDEQSMTLSSSFCPNGSGLSALSLRPLKSTKFNNTLSCHLESEEVSDDTEYTEMTESAVDHSLHDLSSMTLNETPSECSSMHSLTITDITSSSKSVLSSHFGPTTPTTTYPLKQSVSTEITTIKEEDEEELDSVKLEFE